VGAATDQLFLRASPISISSAPLSGVSEDCSRTGNVCPVARRFGSMLLSRASCSPTRPALDDTEIFLRYVREGSGEESRSGTSISIGFLAENFIDSAFPGCWRR